ncbi:MAG: hypothetical protein E6Q97_37905 [Desulfurellales bacterium]|nr:MAG: hypothetical protein E6Q97_37905 [Desulfurellales bacterium]
MTYRIRNWDQHYESAETRKLKRLSWVRVSTKLSGDGYRMLVKGHRNGPAHFAAWVSMLQVAATAKKRGDLVQDNGMPHTAATLSFKTDLPEEWFAEALPRLASPEIGWIEGLEESGDLPEIPGDSPGGIPPHKNKNLKENLKGNIHTTEAVYEVEEVFDESGHACGVYGPEQRPIDQTEAASCARDMGRLDPDDGERQDRHQHAPETLRKINVEALWEEFIGLSMAAGKQYSEGQVMLALRDWLSYGDDEKLMIFEDYKRKCFDGTWSDARHTPLVGNYLKTGAWKPRGTGVRILPVVKPMSKSDESQHAAAQTFLSQRR